MKRRRRGKRHSLRGRPRDSKGRLLPKGARRRKRRRKARAAAAAAPAAAPRRRRRRRRRARAAAPAAAPRRRRRRRARRHGRRRAKERIYMRRAKRRGQRTAGGKRALKGGYVGGHAIRRRRRRRRAGPAIGGFTGYRGPGARRAGEARRHRRRRHHRRSAMENPLTVTEIVVAGIVGVTGFVAADWVDRLIATHALNASGQDVPDGTKFQVYNTEAVQAPILKDWKRQAAGGAMTVIPIIVGGYLPRMWKTGMQMFGIGAGVHWVGKNLTDLTVKLLGAKPTGSRLFAGEIRAANIASLAKGSSDGKTPPTLYGLVFTPSIGPSDTPSTPPTLVTLAGMPKQLVRSKGMGGCGGACGGTCASCSSSFEPPPPGPSPQQPAHGGVATPVVVTPGNPPPVGAAGHPTVPSRAPIGAAGFVPPNYNWGTAD